jgi:hypothetical protein
LDIHLHNLNLLLLGKCSDTVANFITYSTCQYAMTIFRNPYDMVLALCADSYYVQFITERTGITNLLSQLLNIIFLLFQKDLRSKPINSGKNDDDFHKQRTPELKK